jgi:signal transduction histidine kinase/ActR/RegA family two-component response regulator
VPPQRPGPRTGPLTRESIALALLFLVVVVSMHLLHTASVESVSAARAFVNGEAMWSKAQKDAIASLTRFARTRNEGDWQRFQSEIDVILGDRRARLALDRPDPDFAAAREGLLQGRNHPDDVEGMTKLFVRFRRFPAISKAIDVWEKGDAKIDELLLAAQALRRHGGDPELERVRALNVELTALEKQFSEALGEGARWAVATTRTASTIAASILLTVAFAFSWRVLVRLRRSERERLAGEERLRQALKMEAVGRLAGGVAHDFNNLLTVILGWSNRLNATLPPDSKAQAAAAEIERAAKRATGLTSQMLAVSRKQVLSPEPVDLHDAVSELREMLRGTLGERVRLDVRGTPGRATTLADRGQLAQVLLNLVLNARDAVAEGGNVVVEVDAVRLDAETAAQLRDGTPGLFARLTVRDDGPGMDAEVLERIFEPFFTTKGPGKGTGLGLATVYGIVRQSGGFVHVESRPGHGATFRVHLPLVDPAAGKPALPRVEAASLDRPAGAAILVVEDEDALRALVVDIVRAAGYRVIEAADATEAAAAFESDGGGVALLVTDVVMPGESGVALARRLRATRPDLPVLFMSGYTAGEIGIDPEASGIDGFLPKPFTVEALQTRVAQMLEQACRR